MTQMQIRRKMNRKLMTDHGKIWRPECNVGFTDEPVMSMDMMARMVML